MQCVLMRVCLYMEKIFWNNIILTEKLGFAVLEIKKSFVLQFYTRAEPFQSLNLPKIKSNLGVTPKNHHSLKIFQSYILLCSIMYINQYVKVWNSTLIFVRWSHPCTKDTKYWKSHLWYPCLHFLHPCHFWLRIRNFLINHLIHTKHDSQQ